MRTVFDIGDEVECKLIGKISRIEISENKEEYTVQIRMHQKVPMYAPITLTKDEITLLMELKGEEDED